MAAKQYRHKKSRKNETGAEQQSCGNYLMAARQYRYKRAAKLKQVQSSEAAAGAKHQSRGKYLLVAKSKKDTKCLEHEAACTAA